MIAGFISSRTQRRVDRRHFAAFLGFSTGTVSVIATMVSFTIGIVWLRPPELPYYHPTLQGMIFVSESIGILATGLAFVAGLFSGGTARVKLLTFGPVM